MPSIEHSRLLRYGIALAIPIFVLLLSLLIRPVTDRAPYTLFFLAVALSAGLGGFGPGPLTGLVSVI